MASTCTSCAASVPSDAAFCPHCGHPTGREPGLTGGVAGRLQEALGPGYDVRGLVGQGGFAEVLEVWDRDLQRRLAVKVLRPDIAWTASMLERFREEARSLAKLTHPGILPIHFVGSSGDLTWYAMPFVEGQTLGDLLRVQGALETDRAITILRPVLDALEYAHRQGLVHRDIKPDNILIEAGTGRILLLDFGIAKQLDRDGGLTQAGITIGSPLYMSPEQAMGRPDIDHRSDIYAIGALLYHMVTGAPPFGGSTSEEIVGKHITEPVQRPSAAKAGIPSWMSELILRCLEKKPENRFQSVGSLRDALRESRVSGSPDLVSTAAIERRLDAGNPTVRFKRPRNGGSRLWLRWVVAALIVLVLAIVLTQFTRPRLILTNQLIEPVEVQVGDDEARIAAGGSSRIVLARGQPAMVAWRLVPRTLRNGDTLGIALAGGFTIEQPRGRIPRDLTASSGDTAWFAPLITNETGVPLRVTVNAGSAAATSCGCVVPVGSERQPIGYYPLYANSTVQVEGPEGRTATFRDLGARVTDSGGAVGLRFGPRDLR